MKIVEEEFDPENLIRNSYPLTRLSDNTEEILFFDIETTGLSARMSSLYLIGCAYTKEEKWFVRQFFADEKADEQEVIQAFFSFCVSFSTLISFNGNRFDIPYIKYKCDKYGIPFALERFTSVDIYKRVAPYKNILGIPDCKQKTVELFLGINRTDIYNGGQLIELYKKYLDNKDEELYKVLLLHNSDDVKGMIEILPVLFYHDLFQSILGTPGFQVRCDGPAPEDLHSLPIRAVKVRADHYEDINGADKQELYMKIAIPDNLPVKIGGTYDGAYMLLNGDEGTIRIPIYEGELKYFYSNYKEYYYLPDEDQSIHKSVAEFVDRSYRMQATAATCYTRKPGQFLKQWSDVFIPFFKTDYDSHEIYFELSDYIKRNRTVMTMYCTHILEHIIKGNK